MHAKPDVIPRELIGLLREFPRAAFPSELHERIVAIEHAGAFVTILEVIVSRALLIYTHSTPRPKPERIRHLYLAHIRGETA